MMRPPACSMNRSSKSEKAKLVGAWIVATTVAPSFASSFSSTQTSFAMRESRPEVGSSRKTTFGRVISASAMFTRFAWPPEMPRCSWLPMTVLRHFCRRSNSMTSSHLCRFSALLTLRGSFSSAVYISICSTVSSPTKVSNCST
mmetsp:Transcript_132996/g.323256  ORF Transcript_132996/g.323256 Transcript_132996/m.323256 type:complete len:144 (-) Transcript_132996:366-797(-)